MIVKKGIDSFYIINKKPWKNASTLPRFFYLFARIIASRDYSNSPPQSCLVVDVVGFGGRKLGFLYRFYLVRGFVGDCIVILLSAINLDSVLSTIH